MKRTLIKELKQKVGEEVLVQGWVHLIRELGEISFLILRERTGLVQIVLSREQAKPLSPESVIEVVGTVKEEPRSQQGIEVAAKQIKVVSKACCLPVPVAKQTTLSLPVLIQHRPLTLRIEKQQAIFKVQAELIWAFREFLKKQGFTEIQSTKLTAGGLEGGSEMFPIEYFGQRAYLAQSPQFYKQMMVGVFERVFEVGKVYRAEPHATPRHLAEYVGLDIEMGFISSFEEVMAIEEALLRHIFEHIEKTCQKELELFGAKVPKITSIPCIPFKEAVRMLEEEYLQKFSSEDLTPEMERLLCELVWKKYASEFVFVTKYPLQKRPFYTMPSAEEGCSESFDLLFRGLEITTGGQRIHQYEELIKAMERKGLKPEAFESYLACFKYGMPPHGGCGIGAERTVKQLLGLQSVEEASLIPRTRERFLH